MSSGDAYADVYIHIHIELLGKISQYILSPQVQLGSLVKISKQLVSPLFAVWLSLALNIGDRCLKAGTAAPGLHYPTRRSWSPASCQTHIQSDAATHVHTLSQYVTLYTYTQTHAHRVLCTYRYADIMAYMYALKHTQSITFSNSPSLLLTHICTMILTYTQVHFNFNPNCSFEKVNRQHVKSWCSFGWSAIVIIMVSAISHI